MNVRWLGRILICLSLGGALGQSADKQNRGPVQAEFLKRLQVRNLAAGDTVYAKVTLDWSAPDCDLRNGAILEGTVETAEPRKTRSESRLALSFNKAQCNGTDMKPLNLVLAAVADAPEDWSIVPDSQFRMPMSFSNPHPSGGGGPGFGTSGFDTYDTHLELAGVLHHFPMSPKVKPGVVLGIKGLKLDIGTGPNRSSVLSSKRGDVALGEFTQILLVPASVAFLPEKVKLTEDGIPARAAAARPAAPAAPVNDLDTCAPPGCAIDLPTDPGELEGSKPATVDAHALGYAPRTHKIVAGFEEEDALAWLGEDELLFTFNRHSLVQRSSVRAGTARVIRAVLLDARSRSVIRAMDWQISDESGYLWPLDGGRVLVHVGDELRVYGAGLELEKTIPLAGPLAFVRISPNGELIAVATLRERHSPELHAKLRDALQREPEEDVDVAILGKEFATMGKATTISGLMPPTLLNEGQVKLLARPPVGYRLTLGTWDGRTETLARFESMCTPQLAGIHPDLLFVLSCNAHNGDTEYRVLRGDGKMLLKGKADPRQTGFEASGNHGRFAIKAVHAMREITPGQDFTGEDLDNEEVRVYRAEDGKRLLSVRVKEPVTSHGSYALSADGAALAVLSGTEIQLFQVPVE
ncbi:MAG TPA: hypothetical protein VG267_22135 [Terracidiphilus sp.]|jgi:hypothetical protein|nr:hypothetical protein [Terracidiphilus sp.]